MKIHCVNPYVNYSVTSSVKGKGCAWPFTLLLLILAIQNASGQDCKFDVRMGENYDKCTAVCLGRSYKCIADGTCLCQKCPNQMPQSYVHTFEDATCKFNQECTRKCMEVNAEPEYGGSIGRGNKCEFSDDFYGRRSSVCVCGCM